MLLVAYASCYVSRRYQLLFGSWARASIEDDGWFSNITFYIRIYYTAAGVGAGQVILVFWYFSLSPSGMGQPLHAMHAWLVFTLFHFHYFFRMFFIDDIDAQGKRAYYRCSQLILLARWPPYYPEMFMGHARKISWFITSSRRFSQCRYFNALLWCISNVIGRITLVLHNYFSRLAYSLRFGRSPPFRGFSYVADISLLSDFFGQPFTSKAIDNYWCHI